MFDTIAGLGDAPPKTRSMSPDFVSLRLDSRGGVGGLAARVGNIDLLDDDSPMATRAVYKTTLPSRCQLLGHNGIVYYVRISAEGSKYTICSPVMAVPPRTNRIWGKGEGEVSHHQLNVKRVLSEHAEVVLITKVNMYAGRICECLFISRWHSIHSDMRFQLLVSGRKTRVWRRDNARRLEGGEPRRDAL
jgi:hypothetical protein